jgi:hypothetical protein
MKDIQIRKEGVKLSLAADNIILHTENHKVSAKKLIKEFSNVTRKKYRKISRISIE